MMGREVILSLHPRQAPSSQRDLSLLPCLSASLLPSKSFACVSRALRERTNCAFSCPETERGVRTNSFICHTTFPDPRKQRPCERRNCAVLRNNSFSCHTCAFHGGGINHFKNRGPK